MQADSQIFRYDGKIWESQFGRFQGRAATARGKLSQNSMARIGMALELWISSLTAKA